MTSRSADDPRAGGADTGTPLGVATSATRQEHPFHVDERPGRIATRADCETLLVAGRHHEDGCAVQRRISLYERPQLVTNPGSYVAYEDARMDLGQPPGESAAQGGRRPFEDEHEHHRGSSQSPSPSTSPVISTVDADPKSASASRRMHSASVASENAVRQATRVRRSKSCVSSATTAKATGTVNSVL